MSTFNRRTLKKFFWRLKSGDFSAIFRAAFFLVGWLLGRILSLPWVVLLYALKPVYWVKIGRLRYERIGHLASNTDLFLRRRQIDLHPPHPSYYFVSDSIGICNRQLLDMHKRLLNVFESRFLVAVYDGLLPVLQRTPFYEALPNVLDEYYEYQEGVRSLYFSDTEMDKGKKILAKMGIDLERDRYVCVFARDDAYLNSVQGFQSWSYNDYRDVDIQSFEEAMKLILAKGWFVIRVGSIVKKPVALRHPKLIDYPYSDFRGDFMDIFLPANSFFFLGTPSGYCDLANCFDTPRIVVNSTPFGDLPFGKNNLYIPKKIKNITTGNYLTFQESQEMGLDQVYETIGHLGLGYEDNSPEDIVEVTQEMIDRLEGRFEYHDEDRLLMHEYYDLLSKSRILCRKVKTPIGRDWLKKNRGLYLPPKNQSMH